METSESVKDDWEPDASQLLWTRNLIRSMKDHETWAAPAFGIMIIDKTKNTLTRTVRTPGSSEVLFQRTIKAFKACGYEVIDKAGEKTNG